MHANLGRKLTIVMAGAGLALITLGRAGDAAADLAGTPTTPVPAAAAVPAESAGSITLYHSPKISLSTSGNSDNGITAGPDGALWFANAANQTIGRITTYGRVTAYQGNGIGNPWPITTGPDGALWVGNWNTHSISRITIAGKVTTFLGTANTPVGIAASNSYLWYSNWAIPS
jgi:streptogramin lyase